MSRIYKYDSPEKLFEYVLSGMHLKDIAKKYNVSIQAIHQELRKYEKYHEIRDKLKEKNIVVKEDYELSWARMFWGKILKTDYCWIWNGSKSKYGYGRKRYHGSYVYVHRKMWEIYNGNIPIGMFICHHCDNPICCNPGHLFLGTAADNAHDRDAKGRNSKNNFVGVNSKISQRSNYKKERARELKNLGKTNNEIANELKCHPNYVYYLLHCNKVV